MPEPLSPQRLRRKIDTSLSGEFGQTLEYHPQIGSTNDRLRELADQGAPHGALVITDEQTTGRGRLGRRWDAPPHTAVLMSVLFRPDLPPAQVNRLVMCCGLAIREAAKPVTLVVKWPNDLLINGKKVAGILPESVIIGDRLEYISDAKGAPLNRENVVTAILHHLNRLYTRLHHPSLHRDWEKACVTMGQHVEIKLEGKESFTALAEGITPEGRLKLRMNDGSMQAVSLSEATIVSTQTP